MPETNLFSDFHKISAKEWKQKIQFDLQGVDYNNSLVWESLEGIKVKPFYHADDHDTRVDDSIAAVNSWKIGQNIYVSEVVKANNRALDLQERGAESLLFVIPSEAVELDILLNGIDLERAPIHFELHFLSFDYIKSIVNFTKTEVDNIHINVDPIGNLARTGNWFFNKGKDYEILNDIIGLNHKQVFSIDLSLYQNAGANMVQQLAYAMAHAHEYLSHLRNDKRPKMRCEKFTFKVSVGSNYFFEISKLRALRILWKLVAAAYEISEDCHIIATPSKRNKTLYEYNVNMVRTTTECMAAALGGANTVFNLPYDSIYHKDNEFGSRIALNQLLLLSEEGYFKEMNYAAEGTYYIQAITDQLAEKALQLFKNIEKGGGFLNQLKSHTIQKKIEESAQKEQDLFDSQKSILVGTNKYQDSNTKMKNDLELYPFVKTKIRKTLLQPILEKRLPEVLEKERLARE